MSVLIHIYLSRTFQTPSLMLNYWSMLLRVQCKINLSIQQLLIVFLVAGNLECYECLFHHDFWLCTNA